MLLVQSSLLFNRLLLQLELLFLFSLCPLGEVSLLALFEAEDDLLFEQDVLHVLPLFWVVAENLHVGDVVVLDGDALVVDLCRVKLSLEGHGVGSKILVRSIKVLLSEVDLVNLVKNGSDVEHGVVSAFDTVGLAVELINQILIRLPLLVSLI